MFPIIDIGPISLPSASFLLLLGIWLGSALMTKQAKSHQRPGEILERILWTGFIAGIVGARLSFIARNPWAFQGQMFNVFSLNPALLDPVGGFLIGLAACYYLVTKHQLKLLKVLDDFTPFFATLIMAIYLASFASGAGFGAITRLPWGIQIWGAIRHPVQLYYLVAGGAVLAYTVFASQQEFHSSGQRFFAFLILTTGYLTVLSAFQDPAGQVILGFRGFQLACWTLFSISIILLQFYFRDKNNEQA
ncbi:MAG: prolipoprotein diacylglyceryl transferase [Anaerolineales bacterium]